MADAASQFVHLHVHSQFSLLDGACRTADLPKRAKELGQSAVAITDHGCLFGLVDFYNKSVEVGVKPIIGIEAYMAPGARTDKSYSGVKDGGYHLLLLAQNLTGYRNLLKLASIAYLEGFYYKPRIDRDVLRAHADGIIATSACLGGEIPSALSADDRKKAKAIAETYLSVFGPDRFFIELQSHIPEQNRINPELIDLADKLGIGTVATNDVHFLLPDDHAPHDALCCISTGKLVSDQSRLIYPTQLYLKSADEMRAAAPDLGKRWHEACDNTVRIAAMCNLELNFKANHAPVVKIVHAPDSLVEPTESSVKSGKTDAAAAPVEGSTQWYKQVCSQFNLLPFDEQSDRDLSSDELKKACDEALRQLTEAGAVWRYGRDGITPDIRARMDRELKVLADKSISAYFLIVWDFVNEARRRGIPSNARGSGVGTMVGYCLGLSNACPVKYGLLFERFTDPDRSEYPDIDIDICQDGRAQVIDYVRRKYGHVAQIITFGTLKARQAIKDVARVMGLAPVDCQKLSDMVPDELNITLDQALEKEPDLRKKCDEDPTTARIIKTARRLEGLARHASVHAAGVIVATQPLSNIVPLYRDPKSGETITQWDGPTCEKVGLLKFDFLGLRTLSIVERAKTLIQSTLDRHTQIRTVTGLCGFGPRPDTPREFNLPSLPDLHAAPDIDKAIDDLARRVDPLDLDRLTFVDQNVLDLFRRGETAGVFQFESGGMRSLLMGMQPDRLEDLIAANALFRPGPMDLIPDYNDRKNGRAPVPSVHPVVDRYTAETYGVMVYQEQVMQILHALGGIALREAYSIIKAISKKKEKQISSARDNFIAGAQKNNLPADDAAHLFDLILKFAGYGFNKSHSTGYAIVAYQTAYLKTYFPLHYMAALLTYESVSTDKVVEYMDECRKVRLPSGAVGIEVRPPDINLSSADFTVVYGPTETRDPNHGHIRFGLSAVKGVGEKAIESVITARTKDGPFRSIFDFCERVPSTLVNKAVIEALIKCGAFDTLHGTHRRAAMIAAVETAMSRGAQEADLRNSEDFLFGAVSSKSESSPKKASRASEDPALPDVTPWDPSETLANEKSVLGFFVSSHPLQARRVALETYSSASLSECRALRADVEVVVGGILTRVRQTLVKNGRSMGQKMAMITIEDLSGSLDGVLFSDAYAQFSHLIEADRIVFLVGKIDRRREEPSIIVNRVIPVEEAPEQLTTGVRITLRETLPDGRPRIYNGELSSLRAILRQCPGPAQVYFELFAADRVVILQADRYKVQPSADLPGRVAAILRDDDCCQLLGPPKINRDRRQTLAQGEATVQNRIKKTTDEMCDSIDRY